MCWNRCLWAGNSSICARLWPCRTGINGWCKEWKSDRCQRIKGVQSYLQRASVGASLHSNPAGATLNSTCLISWAWLSIDYQMWLLFGSFSVMTASEGIINVIQVKTQILPWKIKGSLSEKQEEKKDWVREAYGERFEVSKSQFTDLNHGEFYSAILVLWRPNKTLSTLINNHILLLSLLLFYKLITFYQKLCLCSY